MAAGRTSNLLALLLAPVATALSAGVIYIAVLLTAGVPFEMAFQLSPLVALAHLPAILAGTWLIGLPWHLYSQRVRRTAAVRYWGAGAMVGALLGAGFLAVLWSSGPRSIGLTPADYPEGGGLSSEPLEMVDMLGTFAVAIAYGAMLGGFTGLFAFLIRRPDRDTPANLPTSAP